MSLDKAIKSGKEWRKERRRCCSRTCETCMSSRVHKNLKRLFSALEQVLDISNTSPYVSSPSAGEKYRIYPEIA